MGFKSAVESYRQNGFKYFTPKRAKLFLRSLVRKVTGYRLKEKNAIAFSEIVTYKSLTCPDCAQAGKCRVCKCPVNELFTAMDAPCSDGKFPAFEHQTDWVTIRHELKNFRFKEAWKEMKKRKHWTKGWEEYKSKNRIFFNKFYG